MLKFLTLLSLVTGREKKCSRSLYFSRNEPQELWYLQTKESNSLLINTFECLFLHMMHIMFQTARVIG